MNTEIVKNLTPQDIKRMGTLLREGELVAIPTETVYGLGANGLMPEAMDKIYMAKGRPSDNPLILHVADEESVRPLVKELNETAKKLMAAFWPGPFTMTLEKSELVPNRATGGLNKVALRCPDHALTRAIIKAAGVPIAAPSANISGRPSPTSAEGVYDDMKGKIAAIVDDGPSRVGIESTVVEVLDDEVIILRPGAVTAEMLAEIVSVVRYDKAIQDINEAPKAPGMKYKHYAPKAPLTAYIGEKTPQSMARDLRVYLQENRDTVGVFCSQETATYLQEHLSHEEWGRCHVYSFGRRGDIEAMAMSFYEALLQFDKEQVGKSLAEGTKDKGLGVALMNRMDKATAHQIIDVD